MRKQIIHSKHPDSVYNIDKDKKLISEVIESYTFYQFTGCRFATNIEQSKYTAFLFY